MWSSVTGCEIRVTDCWVISVTALEHGLTYASKSIDLQVMYVGLTQETTGGSDCVRPIIQSFLRDTTTNVTVT